MHTTSDPTVQYMRVSQTTKSTMIANIRYFTPTHLKRYSYNTYSYHVNVYHKSQILCMQQFLVGTRPDRVSSA